MAIVCSTLESEAAELGAEDDIAEYLKELGVAETGLDQVIRLSSSLLGMNTFYTVGPQGGCPLASSRW
jgi:ribosome-binding ATPase